MKTKFSRRILAFVLMLALVVPMFVFNANAEEGTWTLVTDASQLKAGDKVVIVSKTANYAMSTNQKSNNRGAAAITKDTATNTVTINSSVQQFTLVDGKVAGSFGFSTGSGYIYAASSSSNYLKTETNLSNNSSWSITISSGTANIVAQGSNSRKYLQYNPNNGSPLFACYASASQQAVCIYKLTVDEGEPTLNVTGPTYTTIGAQTTLLANAANIEGDVTWTSSDETVATVNGGVVTGLALGKTTITATIGDLSSSVDMVVYPAEGVISIADALKVCELTGANQAPIAYSVIGEIKTISSAYSSQYNNITVIITDGTNDLEVYRMTGGSDLKVGNTIKVTGYLVNYNNSKAEFNSGATYEKITTINDITSSMALAYKYEHEDGIYSNSNFAFKFTIDATVADIADITAYGIKVSAGGKDVYYNEEESISWTEENGKIYVIVELGDIINDTAKLETVFTVTAYVEADGDILTSKNSTSYSVASIVAHYVDTLGIEEITHLYDFISNEHGLI